MERERGGGGEVVESSGGDGRGREAEGGSDEVGCVCVRRGGGGWGGLRPVRWAVCVCVYEWVGVRCGEGGGG